jgi:hypothetical protein
VTASLTSVTASETLLSALEIFGTKAEVFNISFTAESAVISISLGMSNPSEISYFIGLLRETDLFRDITYTGYSAGRGGVSSGLGSYTFVIQCHVRERKPLD